jgi:hypothetical protein
MKFNVLPKIGVGGTAGLCVEGLLVQ